MPERHCYAFEWQASGISRELLAWVITCLSFLVYEQRRQPDVRTPTSRLSIFIFGPPLAAGYGC